MSKPPGSREPLRDSWPLFVSDTKSSTLHYFTCLVSLSIKIRGGGSPSRSNWCCNLKQRAFCRPRRHRAAEKPAVPWQRFRKCVKVRGHKFSNFSLAESGVGRWPMSEQDWQSGWACVLRVTLQALRRPPFLHSSLRLENRGRPKWKS